MDNRVLIRYDTDVIARDGQPSHVVGETFVLPDAVIAHELHPKATVTGYASGAPFVASQDPSLIAQKEAEAAAQAKADADAKAQADAEKAAKAEAAKANGKAS